MARGVTQDRVNQAADAVLQRGERPTIEKVRAELGTGSPNTLIRLLDVWWAELAERLAAQARANLPGLPEAVARAMQTVWSEAVVAARVDASSSVASREEALAQQLEAACEERERLTLALKRSEARSEETRGSLDETLAHLSTERSRGAALQDALNQALRSVEKFQVQLAEVNSTAAAAIARHHSELDRLSASEQRWLREVDRLREEVKGAQRQAAQATNVLERERARQRTQIAQHRDEVRQLKIQLQEAKKLIEKPASRRPAAPSQPLQRRRSLPK